MTALLTQCSTRAATAAASGAAPVAVRRSDLAAQLSPCSLAAHPLISTLPPNGRTRSRTPMRRTTWAVSHLGVNAAAVILDGEHQLVGVGPHRTSVRVAPAWRANVGQHS